MKRKRLLLTEMLKNSNKTRKIFLLLAAVTVCFCMTNEAMAQTVDSGETGDCTWTLTGTPDNYTLTISGTGAMGELWPPNQSSITTVIIENGVTSIGELAFCWFEGLTSITIPQSVTSIGMYAFEGCISLPSITLPTNLTSIEMGIFASCHSLASITVPANVTSINGDAFGGCSSLTAIQVESGNTHFSSVDGVLINNDEKTLLAYPEAKTGDFTIPEGLTTIGEYAFSSSKLKAVSIAQSVTRIEVLAFNNCQHLTDITVFWDTPSEVALSPGYTNGIFQGMNKSAVFLHVPAGTEAAYRAIDTWKDFYGIDWTLLGGLTADNGKLEPDFSSGVFSYSLLVPSDVENLVLAATPFEGSNSTVSGNGAKTLNTGKNTFEITVTASYGGTRNYTVNVFRQPENYLLGWDSHADTYTQMELTLATGKFRTGVITGRNLYYNLQTGDFSGNLPLHFDLENGVTCERTVAVQPHSLYKIRVYVPITPDQPIKVTTPYDAYGRPGTPYVDYTYHPWTITASDGSGVIQTETTVTGTVTTATVADITLEGSLTGIVPVEKASLRIYPNPTPESFRIEGITASTPVTVTDISGKTLLQQTVSGDESISVGYLPKGIYLVRVNGMTAKIIKN